MGAFICQISERDWKIARKIGLYGNRENKPDSSDQLRLIDRMSVIRDLISVKHGDVIFFHVVKRESGISTIHGFYEATSTAFYDRTKVWDDEEFFPYRFQFRPIDKFIDFTRRDVFVYISELYNKIETRQIWSIATLENERNMERRAVRKISIEDANKITELILRTPKFDESDSINYEFYSLSEPIVYLEEKIERIGSIENSVKAFLLSCLKNGNSDMQEIFGSVSDYVNETFVAQTTRKIFDVLIISRNNGGKDFCIIEAKPKTYTEENLGQLLNYLDLFRQRAIFNKNQDRILGYALAPRFSGELPELVSILKHLEIFDGIDLIRYNPEEDGKSAQFNKVSITPPNLESTIVHNSSVSNSEEISYDGVNFEKESSDYERFTIEKIFLTNDDGRVHLKDFLISKTDLLDIQNSLDGIRGLKDYIESNKNNDYSEASLIFEFKEINGAALKIIKTYNEILARPPIILRKI